MHIIVHGFNFSKSFNANSICINNLIEKYDKEICIYTTFSDKEITDIEIHKNNNVTLYKIPFNFETKESLGFKDWIPLATELIIEIMSDSESKRLISVSNPVYFNKVGIAVSSQISISWDIYYLDPYSFNQSNRFKKMFFPIRFLTEVSHFIKSRNIYLTNELYDQYSNNFLMRIFNHKYIKTGIPVLNLNDVFTYSKDNNPRKNIFIYSGMFYPNIRNPKAMFSIFNQINELLSNVELWIYGVDKKTLELYTDQEIPSYVRIKGRVSQSELRGIINKPVYLVNIGNTVTNQLPSKIMDYVSTGNPILNFISIEKDTSKIFLEKYKGKINIDTATNLSKVLEFIDDFRDYKVDRNSIIIEYDKYSIDSIERKVLYEIHN